MTITKEKPMEFLVEFEVDVPDGAAASEVDARRTAEAAAAARLVDEGHLVRLWKAAGAPISRGREAVTAARKSASWARMSWVSISCCRAARRQRRCPNQVARPPAMTPSIAITMISANSGIDTETDGLAVLKGSNETVTK